MMHAVDISRFTRKIKSIARVWLLFISGRAVIHAGLDIAKHQGLASAITYLQKKTMLYRPRSVRFVIALYTYLMTISDQPTLKKAQFIVHVCCWGNDYTEKAIRYLFPSLNAPHNLPFIAQTHTVELVIHCDEWCKQHLMRSSVINELQCFMQITYLVLPASLVKAYQLSTRDFKIPLLKRMNTISHNNKYLMLGALQSHALKLALQYRAYVSFMMPDFVVSDTFFKDVLDKIKDKKLVATTAFRTDYHAIKSRLDTQLAIDGVNSLSISPDALTALQIDHMHAAAKRRVVSTVNPCFVPSAQLIFEQQDGFIIRSFHYHPILLDCSKLTDPIKVDYLPVDFSMMNQFVTQQIPYDQQIWVCHDSSSMAMMELSELTVDGPLHDVHHASSYVELGQQIRNMLIKAPEVYRTPLNHYFATIRHRVIPAQRRQNRVIRGGEPLTFTQGQVGQLIDDELFFKEMNLLGNAEYG